MKKFILALLITGIFIVAACFLLPVQSSCTITPGMYNEIHTLIPGYAYIPNYLTVFFLANIMIAAFFRRGISAKISMIIFTVIGILIVFTAGNNDFADSCGETTTVFQYLFYFGCLLILASAYMHKFTQKPHKNTNDALLDNFED